MGRSKKLLFLSGAVCVILVSSACGGNVAVDGSLHGTAPATSGVGGSGTGGNTGVGGSGTGGNTGVGGGSSSCRNKPSLSMLMGCAAGGVGSGGVCETQYSCGSESWSADCTGTTCTCLHNSVPYCSCVDDGLSCGGCCFN